MNEKFEVMFILLFGFFLLLFITQYSFVLSFVQSPLPDVIWKHRSIESLCQGILIFVIIIGILNMERK